MTKESSTRIFIPLPPPNEENSVTPHELIIENGDAHHIKNVLRMNVGDKITVCYNNGSEYLGVIIDIGAEVKLNIIKQIETNSELPISVTLFQAYPKGDKLDLIVQKCTELGINKIIPVISDRCISRPNAKSAQHKRSRLMRIAESAAKQSGRSIVPEISDAIFFSEAVQEIKKEELGFVCYEGSGTVPLPQILQDVKGNNIAFFIGPEGGLSLNEVDEVLSNNIPLVGLGRRILRTETAPILVMSAISLLFC